MDFKKIDIDLIKIGLCLVVFGISYLLFDADNSNIAWGVSGKCAKELEKVLPLEWINEKVELKFYKNYSSRYDIYYVMLEDIPVIVK